MLQQLLSQCEPWLQQLNIAYYTCCTRSVPELLLENVSHYLVAAKRFEVAGVIHEDAEHLEPVLTNLLVFMSGSVRAHNPHLRAQLAECLESLLPQEKTASSLSKMVREHLFKNHPHRFQVSFCLILIYINMPQLKTYCFFIIQQRQRWTVILSVVKVNHMSSNISARGLLYLTLWGQILFSY